MKFSASRTALLLQCNAPFQENVVEPSQKRSEAALVGTRVHEEIANYLLSASSGPMEIDDEIEPYMLAFFEWWGDFRLSFRPTRLIIEEAMAFDTRTGQVRALPSKGHRDYSDLSKSEVAGTLDFAAFNAEKGWVLIDWKVRAPGNVHDMKDPKPQLATLGSMFAELHQPHDYSGLTSSQIGFDVTCYALEIYKDRCVEGQKLIIPAGWKGSFSKDHLSRLSKRLIEPASFVVGFECVHCPMRGSCPALRMDPALDDLFEKDSLSAEDVRGGYSKLRVWEEKLRGLRDSVKEAVEREGEIQLSEHRKLVLEQVSSETLSKSSVMESYGKEEGVKVLQSLRERGAIRQSESTRMVERSK